MFVLDDRGRVATWAAGAEHVFGYTSGEMTDEPAATLFDMSPAEFGALTARGAAARPRRARRRVPPTRRQQVRRRDDDPSAAGRGRRPAGLRGRHPRRHRAAQPRSPLAAEPEDGGDRPARRRHRARLQQPVDRRSSATREWLERGLAGDPERKQEVAEIQRAAERAAALTRQLLAFSRRQMSRPAPVNLSRLVNDLLPMLRRVIGEHDHGRPRHAARRLAPCSATATSSSRSSLNLAVNARDAMPSRRPAHDPHRDGSRGRRVCRGELTPGQHVLLEVADTGIGMDRATLGRIFEPFFTTKEFGRGTGLGLATVYGIVKQMGGAIRVETEVGQGTTFRLYFPETHEREADKRRARRPASLPRGHETVLLVEDDDVVRTFLRRALERHGLSGARRRASDGRRWRSRRPIPIRSIWSSPTSCCRAGPVSNSCGRSRRSDPPYRRFTFPATPTRCWHARARARKPVNSSRNRSLRPTCSSACA